MEYHGKSKPQEDPFGEQTSRLNTIRVDRHRRFPHGVSSSWDDVTALITSTKRSLRFPRIRAVNVVERTSS